MINFDGSECVEMDIPSIKTHVDRVRACAGTETNTYSEEDSLALVQVLARWWKDAFYGQGKTMFKLEELIKPYGMKVPTALWCVSFFGDEVS